MQYLLLLAPEIILLFVMETPLLATLLGFMLYPHWCASGVSSIRSACT
ncbi:hypothetical protein [Chitinophaga pinensis]|nr:hypothetical protein [Chitinophaga pinensis]